MDRVLIDVTGTVQGVGFRPFVYRLAKRKGISGYVKNSGNSVSILAVGSKGQIKSFLEGIKNEHPPLARIVDIRIAPAESGDEKDFCIEESNKEGRSESVLPPDVSICNNCLKEIKEKGNRRKGYPFTVCVDCGPRFTIIESVPYDRANTSMADFAMCGECFKEYDEPADRRFHAEPTCCPTCGPRYHLYKGKEKIISEDPIREAVQRLEEGCIVAIMGVGGTHLASKVDDENVRRLRERFGRREKPFAIMARDLKSVEEFAYLNELEKELLTSLRRPIVILDRKRDLPALVAPGLENIGVMLPYTALHHLVFDHTVEKIFIMTSANLPGEPMFTSQKDVITSGFSDYSLVHDRRIINRADDSVIRVVAGKSSFIRRSRGYVPEPISLSEESDEIVLGLGAELNITGCLIVRDKAFLTQYIGDTTKIKTLEFMKNALNQLMKLTKVKVPDRIVIDRHPDYATRRLGEELSDKYQAPLVEVQHHFAHTTSLMAETRLDEMVCLALDGAGYGTDGTVWGGEVIFSGDGKTERYGSLAPQLMPGGDLAAIYPARMLAGILYPHYTEEELKDLLSKKVGQGFRKEEINLVIKQLNKRFNSPLTTSMGRILDATAALLDVCYERTYEGEPAMKLEALAKKGEPTLDLPKVYSTVNDRPTLDAATILISAIEALDEVKKEDIAASVQNSITRGLSKMAIKCAEEKKIDDIGVSGGVAYNNSIVTQIERIVTEKGFEFHIHSKVPPGDGGISLGQCWHVTLSR